MREDNTVTEAKIATIYNQLKSDFRKDWLLQLELYELALHKNYEIKNAILETLQNLKSNKSYTSLIENGLNLH